MSSPSSRESNDAVSVGRFRYRVDVSQDWRSGVFNYRVKVTRTSDNTSKISFKSFNDFVSFDSDLRQNTSMFQRNRCRGGSVPRLPTKQNVFALWGRRHRWWLEEGMPASFQQYLEDVLQRISFRRPYVHLDTRASIRVDWFLCTEIAGPSGGVRQLPTPPPMTFTRQLGIDDVDTSVQDLSLLLEVQQGNGESCVICQGDLQPHDEVRALACGHTYHLDCISRWLVVRRSCCLCLRPAIPAEVDRLEA